MGSDVRGGMRQIEGSGWWKAVLLGCGWLGSRVPVAVLVAIS
jgi:hypothetical protein